MWVRFVHCDISMWYPLKTKVIPQRRTRRLQMAAASSVFSMKTGSSLLEILERHFTEIVNCNKVMSGNQDDKASQSIQQCGSIP